MTSTALPVSYRHRIMIITTLLTIAKSAEFNSLWVWFLQGIARNESNCTIVSRGKLMLYFVGTKREKSFNCLLLDWSGGCRVCRAGSATPVFLLSPSFLKPTWPSIVNCTHFLEVTSTLYWLWRYFTYHKWTMLYRTIQSSWIIHEYTHRCRRRSLLLTHKRIIIYIHAHHFSM